MHITAVLPFTKRCLSSVGLSAAILATSLASMPFPAKAEEKITYAYTCEIKARRTGNWTPREVRFSLNEGDMTAVVSDPYSYHQGDGPFHVKIKRKEDGMLRFKWRVELPTSEGGFLYVGYTVIFDAGKKTGVFRAAVPSGGHRDGPGTLICK